MTTTATVRAMRSSVLVDGIECKTCLGRGWVPGSTEWPEACPHCQGRGGFASIARFANRLGVTPRQLCRVWSCAPTRTLGVLVLERIAEVFPEELGLVTPEPLFEEARS